MMNKWTLMSSHGVVLFYLAANPSSTMREVAEAIGMTERYVAHLIHDLVQADLLLVTRTGRRNAYAVNRNAFFRHPTLSRIPLSEFERILLRRDGPEDGKDDAGEVSSG